MSHPLSPSPFRRHRPRPTPARSRPFPTLPTFADIPSFPYLRPVPTLPVDSPPPQQTLPMVERGEQEKKKNSIVASMACGGTAAGGGDARRLYADVAQQSASLMDAGEQAASARTPDVGVHLRACRTAGERVRERRFYSTGT